MPSRESVPEEIRARTEFVAAVRTGIDALMGRCGYSRERAVNSLLKELNRGPESGAATWGKPTDDEVFDAMRKHKLSIDEANRAVIVSRAARREMLSPKGNGNGTDKDTTPLDAIYRLIAKISLDNILYESGEDDSDDDDHDHQMAPLKIPKIGRVSSSSSISPSTTSSIHKNKNKNNSKSNSCTTNTSHSTLTGTTTTRKTARNKKLTSPSPRKSQKNSRNNNNNNSSNNNNNNNNTTSTTTTSSSSSSSILVGKKRGIDDLDAGAEKESKAATGRPHRAAKRLHRATSASTAHAETTVSSGMGATK